jgi:hypothetical protein
MIIFLTVSKMQQMNPQEKFQAIMKKYEISEEFALKLKEKLVGVEIVFIADDSGSMGGLVRPHAANVTRWLELRNKIGVTIDLAALMDPTGVDIYFLNRGECLNVTDFKQVEDAFKAPPDGYTPISRVYRNVLKAKQGIAKERKLLTIIATDGIPTDEQGNSDPATLEQVLKHERNPQAKIFTTFMACTDDDEVMKVLNKWDRKIKNVDVVDDYESEKEQIKKKRGKNFPFSLGDYVVKTLVGSLDEKMDKEDEKSSGCCVIM